MTTPDFDLGNDDDDQGGEGGGTQTFQDLRKYARKQEREAKALTAEVEELRAFRTAVVEEKKEGAIASAFEAAELPASLSKFFKMENPDIEPDAITPEAVQKFAADNGFETVAGDSVPEPEKKEAGFKPVTTGQAAPLAQLELADVHELLRQGKNEEVQRAFAEGRVKKESVPWTQI